MERLRRSPGMPPAASRVWKHESGRDGSGSGERFLSSCLRVKYSRLVFVWLSGEGRIAAACSEASGGNEARGPGCSRGASHRTGSARARSGRTNSSSPRGSRRLMGPGGSWDHPTRASPSSSSGAVARHSLTALATVEPKPDKQANQEKPSGREPPVIPTPAIFPPAPRSFTSHQHWRRRGRRRESLGEARSAPTGRSVFPTLTPPPPFRRQSSEGTDTHVSFAGSGRDPLARWF